MRRGYFNFDELEHTTLPELIFEGTEKPPAFITEILTVTLDSGSVAMTAAPHTF